MKRVKLFALISLLFIGLGHAWGENVTITKTIDQLKEANSWSVSSGSTIKGCYTSFSLDDNITISTSGKPNCGSIWGTNTYDWRLYQTQNGDITITAKEGCSLSSITLIYSINNNGCLIYNSTTLSSNSPITVSGTKVTFIVGNTGTDKNGQIKITSFSITYTSGSSGGVTYTNYLTECAAASEYSVTNNLFGLESDAENPTTVAVDATYLTLTYSAAEGYLLPTSTDNITVKVGNTTLTANDDYTFNSETGELWIMPNNGFTGDVDITIYGKLQPPTNVAVSEITANSATITWTKNPSATDYIITYTAGGETIQKQTGNVDTYTLTGLTPNTEYACTIKAIDINSPKTNSAEVNAHFTTTAAATYTITWNANGTTYTTTQVTEGNAVVLPAAPASCSGTYTHFEGWFTEAAGNDSDPSKAPLGTQVTAATVPTGDATYYAVFSDEQLSGELTLATSIVNGDKIYLATSPTGTGVTGADGSKDAIVSTTKEDWMLFTVVDYSNGTFKLKNGTNYVTGASSSFQLTGSGTQLSLNKNGYFTFINNKDTYCLFENAYNGMFYRCYNISLIGQASYTQFFMYKAGTPATGYISSCCTDAAVVTITPASSTVNIGADGNATTTVSCSQTGGGTGAWTYSVSPSDGATFNGTTFTATKAGTYTLTATYTETCGKSAKTTITVTKNPTLYFTTEPADPIVFEDPKCGGHTTLENKKSVDLQGYNLTGNVTVTVTGDYKIARTASAALGDYTTSLTLDKTAVGEIKANYKTIYILSTPPAAKTDATNGTLTITTEGGNTLTVNLSTPTITCTKYTLTFIDRGGTHQTVTQYAGTAVAEPDDPTGVCTEPINYVFDGWAEATVSEGSTSYTKVNFPYTMPKNNTTKLYAVYKYVEDGALSNDFNSVDVDKGDLVSGEEYVLTALNPEDNTEHALSSNLAETGKYQSKDVSVIGVDKDGDTEDDYYQLTTTDKEIIWTLTGDADNGYSFKNASTGSFLTNSNGTLELSETADTKFTISHPDAKNWEVDVKLKDDTKYLSGYYKIASSAVLFNLHSSSTLNLYLYKRAIASKYTTSPACGPHVRVTAGKDVYVTAGNAGGTRSIVQVQDTVKFVAGALKGNGSNRPSIKIPAADIKIGETTTTKLTCDIIEQNVTKNGDGTYSISGYIVLKYKPTEFNKTEDIQVQLRAEYNTTTDVSLDNFTVHARALPERFVIAAKHTDGNWYALNGDMSGSKTQFANAHLTVNDTDAPTQATLAACNTLYTFDGMPNGGDLRYVRFIGTTQRYLWAAKGVNTGIQNNAKNQPTALDSAYNWLLQTSDNITYQFANMYNNRTLALYKSSDIRFGMYENSNGTHDIRILPVVDTCVYNYAPTKIDVIARSTTATLTWDAVAGADKYQYRASDAEWTDGTSSPTITLSGLSQNTEYTYFVRAVHGTSNNICSDEASVTFTTADCDDVPYDISYTSDVNSITLTWAMTSATATVQVFSDADGKTQVGSYKDKTSPCTITGLTKATTYYVKILAGEGETCPSALVEVSTERPQLDVVEWKQEGIDVAINTNEKISVVLENQVTKGTGTGQVANELFFSKYYEATGNVKLIAIYNGTLEEKDLTKYRISIGTDHDGWNYKQIGASDFEAMGKTTLQSNEELVLYYFDKDSKNDASIIECVNNHKVFDFSTAYLNDKIVYSGRQNFLLEKTEDGGTTYKKIDLMGAMNADGTNLEPKEGVTGACVPSWGDITKTNESYRTWCGKGPSIDQYEVDGSESIIDISMNRCLLIRKKTVLDGYNAVTKNIGSFYTLGGISESIEGEWLGRQVEQGTDNGVTSSCAGFEYVGGFDYNKFYTTYDSLTTVEFDNSNRNPDGTLTISIPRMDTLACKGLKIIAADESGNVLTTKEYRVPILITENASTNSTKYFRFSGDTCKTCDVVIRNNATLTKEADGADNDKPQVRDVMVYEGSSLVVPIGTNYTVNSLSLRRREDSVAVADVAGTLNINSTSDKPVYLDMRITAENWHWFTLPYDCAIADVTWSNEQAAKYRTDWFLMYYDGARRATGVDSGNWKEYDGDSIAAGQGFIIGIKGDGNDKHAFELRFPMAKEVITKDGEDKTVPVYAYGAGKDVRPNHKGWNLVGNPYLNYYKKGNINSFVGLRLGLLEYDAATGWWDVAENDNQPYIVIPQNFGWSAYQQVLVSSRDLLPFTSYFIQVGKDTGYGNGQRCEVQFDKDQRGKSAKAALMANNAADVEEEPVITGIVLRNAQGESDETSLVIAEQFSSSYEMGADFFKWFGDYYKYYTLPVLYSIGDDGGKRAFNAVNEAGAKQSIPLGMYAARDGEYTFSLNTRSDLSRVDKVWLYDAESGLYTDLLREDYTFATTRTEGSGRFFLSVVLKAKEITTGASDVRYGDLRLSTDKQSLVVRGLPEAAEVWVYDPSGKLLHHEQTRHYERHYAVPQQGTYLVRVESQDGGVTLRGVCR